jgi:arylsulfatase A-like enzyme
VNRHYLAPYGEVAFTPHLERFARQSVVFTRHHTEAGTSGIAYASLFSGTHADRHGVYTQPIRLAEGQHLITEAFAAAGYETFFWNAHNAASARLRYGQGVAASHTFSRRLDAADPDFVALLDRLRSEPESKAFVLTNFTVTHAPYRTRHLADFLRAFPSQAVGLDPSEVRRFTRLYRHNYLDLSYGFDEAVRRLGLSLQEQRSLTATIERLYQSNVHRLDSLFGQVLDAIDSRDLRAESLVVFTADHGEVLRPENSLLPWSHSFELAPEVVQVPLLVSSPGVAGRYEGVSRSIDVYPTLAGLAGVAIPPEAGVEGVDLARSMQGLEPAPELIAASHSAVLPHALFEQLHDPRRERTWGQLRRFFPAEDPELMWVSMRAGDFFYRLRKLDERRWGTQAFDLASAPSTDVFDPDEAEHREMAQRLESYKAQLLAAYPSESEARERALDAEDAAELLRALGYVE